MRVFQRLEDRAIYHSGVAHHDVDSSVCVIMDVSETTRTRSHYQRLVSQSDVEEAASRRAVEAQRRELEAQRLATQTWLEEQTAPGAEVPMVSPGDRFGPGIGAGSAL